MTEPTLDEVLTRMPSNITREDLEAVVKQARFDRGLWENRAAITEAKKVAATKKKEENRIKKEAAAVKREEKALIKAEKLAEKEARK